MRKKNKWCSWKSSLTNIILFNVFLVWNADLFFYYYLISFSFIRRIQWFGIKLFCRQISNESFFEHFLLFSHVSASQIVQIFSYILEVAYFIQENLQTRGLVNTLASLISWVLYNRQGRNNENIVFQVVIPLKRCEFRRLKIGLKNT